MFRKSPVPRILLALFMLSAVAVPVTGASAAPTTAPNLMSPASGATVNANPVFRWGAVPGASDYRIEISHSASFNSTVWSDVTVNRRATPTDDLPLGTLHWRVAAVDDSGEGPFATGDFTKVAAGAPVPVSPEDGVSLSYPQDPPVFSWDPVPGAKSYELEIDTAAHFVGATPITTAIPTYVATESQTAGQTFFWRVRGVSEAGIRTAWSPTRSYSIEWAGKPVLVSPSDSTATPIQDVVLEWQPVLGASDYRLQVSPNGDWANNLTLDEVVKSTRYSPPATFNNGSYFWRVRARSSTNVSDWSDPRQFRRGWPDKPTLLTPAAGSTTADPVFSWTPVKHAAYYEIDVSTDANFTPIPTKLSTCTTDQTSWVPYSRTVDSPIDGCTSPSPAFGHDGPVYWRVRAVDAPGDVKGIYSEPSSFTSAAPAEPVGGLPPAVNVSPPDCKTDPGCATLLDTPRLDWDPVAGADKYVVYVAVDPDFTNIVEEYWTAFTSLTPRESYRDNQAGQSYYWFARPCVGPSVDLECGKFENSVFNTASAFRKRSAPVSLTSPADGSTVADQVSFVWADYFTTNQAATPKGEQAGTVYRVEVSRNADFKELIDEREVDQATYTPFDRTYPEGSLYWRVQALDNAGNGLTFSEKRMVTKASPAPALTHPSNAGVVTGTPYLRWTPVPFASRYEVEIAKNGDKTFSPPNLVPTNATSVSALSPAALGPGTYAWRVRRIDVDGRRGQWSDARTFMLKPDAPTLVSPADGAPAGSDLYFEWLPATGASSYELEVSAWPGFGSSQSVKTVMTSFAPSSLYGDGTGVFFWRVKALDSTGNVASVSDSRSFKLGDAALHFRRVTINLNGRLRTKGKVKVNSGFKACARTKVEIQRKKGNTWRTIKSTRSTTSGDYKVRVPAKRGKYRAKLALKRTKSGHLCGANISKMRRF